MSPGATAPLPTSALDDDAWDDLLSFIEERRVIPIVGPELLQVATDRGPRLLYDWLAEKLAGRLNVDVTQLPQPYTLNDVVCWFLGARGRREQAEVSTMLALALIGERRSDEARRIIEPIVKYHRALAARNHGDQQQHVELARALYAQEFIEPGHRNALLHEAASLIDGVPAQMRTLRSIQVWRGRVHAAMHGPAAGAAPANALRGVG
jgi:ABC-type hemin transport system ATPase subunit